MSMNNLLIENETVWQRLKNETRPIIMYGMGDGAEKILNVFKLYDIKIKDIFASDQFVRGHSFARIKVKKFSEIQQLYDDFIIVIAFASQRDDVLSTFAALDNKYDVVVPDVPVSGGGVFDIAFFQNHQKEIQEVYNMFEDDISRQTYIDTINYKISGKLSYLKHSETDKACVFTEILKPQKNETFIDLGAYNGDTIRELLSFTDGEFENIVAFEPDGKTFKKLKKYCDEKLKGRVEIYNAAAWDSEDTLLFAAKAGRNSTFDMLCGVETKTLSVDHVLNGRKATLIKMDVEGAEKEAITGAAHTIRDFTPKLNIAVYHRNDDIFAIPLQLHKINQNYKFYLRHHPYVPSWDTNLYAIPR